MVCGEGGGIGWVGTGMEVKASLGYLMWATFVQYLHETISNTYH